MIGGDNGRKPPKPDIRSLVLEVHVGALEEDGGITNIHVVDHNTKQTFVKIAISSETVAYVNRSGGPLDANRFRYLRDLLSLCFTAVIDSMTDSLS